MNYPTSDQITDILVTLSEEDRKLTETIAYGMAAVFARGVIVGACYEGTPPETYTSREENLIKKNADETWTQWICATKTFISMGK